MTRVRGSTWLLVGMAITMVAAAPMRWVTVQAPLGPSADVDGLDVGGRATVVIGLVILGTVLARRGGGVRDVTSLAVVTAGAVAAFLAATEVVRTRGVDVAVTTQLGVWLTVGAGTGVMVAGLWSDTQHALRRAAPRSPDTGQDLSSPDCPFCAGPRPNMGVDDAISAGLSIVPPYVFAAALMASVSNGPREAVITHLVLVSLVAFVMARFRLQRRRQGRPPKPMSTATRWQLEHPQRAMIGPVGVLTAAFVLQVVLWSAAGATIFMVAFAGSIHVALVMRRHALHHPELAV